MRTPTEFELRLVIADCGYRCEQLMQRSAQYAADYDAKMAEQTKHFAGYWSERAFAASRKLQGSES